MEPRKIISLLLKIAAAVCSIWGVCIVSLAGKDTFMGGGRSLMYFTILSNIVLAVSSILSVANLFVRKENKKWKLFVGVLNFWATVSITLTFVVFCAMLAPFIRGAWALSSLLTHAIAPVSAILDYLFFDREFFPTKKHALLSTVFPLCYLAFTIVAYLCRWEFAPNQYYPYTFLNYGGSAGVFGFSTDAGDSLFLGSFYWVLILIAFVLGVAMLYRKVHNSLK